MTLWLLALSCHQEPDRASVLIVMVDQLRADRVGAYGHLPTDTPNMDAIARQGTLFTRAYATSTLEGPARSSILTGEVPPVHGHRLDKEPEGIRGRGWLADLVDQGWTRCNVIVDASDREKSTSELTKCASGRGVVMTVELHGGEVPGSIGDLDASIGAVTTIWSKQKPKALGMLMGVIGSMEGAREEAALLITDDLVRVPLIVWGQGWEQDWEVKDLVSTIDIGVTILSELGRENSMQGLKRGGSEVAYHESLVGFQTFGTHPLFGFTEETGRYVEGVFGRWYPAGRGGVRAFEDPESEFAEEAQKLEQLRKAFKRNVGLPGDVESRTVDPSERIYLMSLVGKVERLMARGRLDAVDRIINRIAQLAPEAPILESLRQQRAKAQPR